MELLDYLKDVSEQIWTEASIAYHKAQIKYLKKQEEVFLADHGVSSREELQAKFDAEQAELDAKQEELDAKQEELDAKDEEISRKYEDLKQRAEEAVETVRAEIARNKIRLENTTEESLKNELIEINEQLKAALKTCEKNFKDIVKAENNWKKNRR